MFSVDVNGNTVVREYGKDSSWAKFRTAFPNLSPPTDPVGIDHLPNSLHFLLGELERLRTRGGKCSWSWEESLFSPTTGPRFCEDNKRTDITDQIQTDFVSNRTNNNDRVDDNANDDDISIASAGHEAGGGNSLVREEKLFLGLDYEWDSGGDDQEMKLKEIKMGGVTNYLCSYIPIRLLLKLVQFYQSEEFDQHFGKSRHGIMRYNSKGVPNSGLAPHGEYLMNEWGFDATEDEMLQQLQHALAAAVDNFTPSHVACGVIRTVRGMMHQLPHLDHADVLSGEKRAFIGHMGLEQEGSMIRLDVVSDEAMQAMANNIPPNPQKQKIILQSTFVYIPFGSILLLDARQFHGGHYGSNDVFRFHCVISDFNFKRRESNGKAEEHGDHLYLLAKNVTGGFRWLPSTKIREVENWFHKTASEVPIARQEYVRQFKDMYWSARKDLQFCYFLATDCDHSTIMENVYKSLDKERNKDLALWGNIYKKERQSLCGKQYFKGMQIYFMPETCPAFMEKDKSFLTMVEPFDRSEYSEKTSSRDVTNDQAFIDLMEIMEENIPQWSKACNLAGTYFRSKGKRSIPKGSVCIIEGHSTPNRHQEWVVHLPLQGDYWLCLGVPKGYHWETTEGVQLEDTTENFLEWVGTLDGSLRNRISRLCNQLGEGDTCDICCYHMVVGRGIRFPSKHWKHFIVETDRSERPMAALLMHPLTEDAKTAKDQGILDGSQKMIGR